MHNVWILVYYRLNLGPLFVTVGTQASWLEATVPLANMDLNAQIVS